MSPPYCFGFVGTAVICELTFVVSLFHAMPLCRRRQCDCAIMFSLSVLLYSFYFFSARRYAVAAYLLSSCVHPFICLSHAGVVSKRLDESSSFYDGDFFSIYPNCAIGKFGYLQNKCTSLWKFAVD